MKNTFKHVRYHFPEQLRFKHLALNELFIFPAGNGTPRMGPFMKLSARRYVPVRVAVMGMPGRYVPTVPTGAQVVHIGSINAVVSDSLLGVLP
jgi:hypothetical protein